MTLNAFAQAKVVATVGASNLFNFGASVHKQFPQFDPQDPGQGPGDQTTFRDLTDLISPNSLQFLVVSFVWTAVGGQGEDPPVNTPLSQLFNSSSWNDFVTSVESSNLDAVLGSPDSVMSGLASIFNNAAQKTFSDLVNFLTTIQPLNGNGQ